MEGEPGPADVTTLRKFVRERSNSFRDWWRSKRAPHLREGGKSKSEDGFKQTASTGNMASQSEPGGGGGGIFSIGGTASSPPPWTSLSEEVKRKLDEIESKPRSMTEMVTDPGDAGNGKKKGRQVVQPKGTIVYEVRDRDSLTSIAAKFDTTPSVLVKINRLVTRVVFPGQNIFVPDKDYVPSEPTSPVESPTSSATSNPLKIAVGRVEPDLHTPLRSPGHAERVFPSTPPQEVHEIEPPKPLSEDEAKKLDEECYERFIKLNVRYITDGQAFSSSTSDTLDGKAKGVVKGVLLVTPNAVMFDPDVSDPLVQENSPEMYGMIAPMDMIISAAMYHDISIMKLKGEAVGMKPSAKVYHAPDCAIHRADQSESEAAEVTPPTSQSEPSTEEDIADAKIKEKRDRFKRARTVSACSCGAERIVSEALEKVRRSSIDHAGISPKVHDGHSHNDKNEDGDGKNLVQITTVMSTEDKSTGSVTGSNVGASEAATTQSDSSVISQDSKTKMSDVAKANDSADFDPLLSSNSLEQEVHLSDINEVPLVKQKDIPHHHHHHVGPHGTDHNPVAPPDDPIPEVSEAEDIPLEQLVKDDHELSFHSEKDNGDDVDDDFTDSLQKEDGLTYPLEDLLFKCASPTSLDEPPLYLCLKVGIPINKPVSKTCPIESYSKKKKKPEYWFAIPRDKVDHLYAFFIQWSPNIYGDESDIDPQERGFVMIGEEEEEEELALEEEHFVTPSKRIPRRLTRVVSKDWEVVSMDEARRRLEALEVEDTLPLPELIGKSAILEEEHIKALNKKLPPRAEGYPWTQVYSTEQHGFSLHTLYRLMQGLDNPVMIVIKDTDEQIFGALTSDPIKVSDHFYGTGETFLFTFYEEFKTYNWTGENTFFVKGNQHSLAIGAGEGLFGLWLDEDFYHGRTHFCQTFGNEPLTIKEDFVVKNVEVWAFLFDWR